MCEWSSPVNRSQSAPGSAGQNRTPFAISNKCAYTTTQDSIERRNVALVETKESHDSAEDEHNKPTQTRDSAVHFGSSHDAYAGRDSTSQMFTSLEEIVSLATAPTVQCPLWGSCTPYPHQPPLIRSLCHPKIAERFVRIVELAGGDNSRGRNMRACLGRFSLEGPIFWAALN